MEKYSEGYRLLCRFFKEIRLYNEFIEYQKTHMDRGHISPTTDNILRSLGETQFSHWIKYVKGKSVSANFFFIFRYWLMKFHPKFIQGDYSPMPEEGWYPSYFGSPCNLDVEGKKITINYLERK